MTLPRFERTAFRRFGVLGGSIVRNNPHLMHALQRAHMQIRPEVYMATVLQSMAVAVIAALIPAVLFVAAWLVGIIPNGGRIVWLLIPLPIVAALTIYLGALILPDLRAKSRARSIDNNLPFALNFISTMASAGATPPAVFASLARQGLYGAVADEAAWIERDLNVLGYDVVTALNKAIDRSPSARFQDFIQGVITVLTSGGDLKTYFLAKADQFMYENQQEQKKFLESLGVLAESFVVVVVAAPLFLIVMLSVMTLFGGDAKQMLLIGYLMIIVMLPLAQAGFAVTISAMSPEKT
jgi:flagellar protein FlaJ